MPVSRISFQVPSHTGNYGDTGPPVTGFLHEMRWNPSGGTTDTGVVVTLTILGKDKQSGDTGAGFVFWQNSGVNTKLASNFIECPRQPVTYGTTDNSGDSCFEPYLLSHQRIRLRATNDTGTGQFVGTWWFTFYEQ